MSDKSTILVHLDTDPLPGVFDRVVAEIRALEAGLVGHLRTDINDVLHGRLRIDRNEP